MLKNVLIGAGSSTAYTTAASPYLLASGEIGVYSLAADGTYTLITAAISAAQGKLPIVIAQGAPAGKNVKMFTIQPGEKIAYLNTAYAAPVPNVMIAGFDGTNYDLVSGAAGTYDFKVQNLTQGNPPFPTVGSTPYFNTSGAATPIAIASAIVKDVNNQFLLSENDVMPQNRFALAEVLNDATRNAGSGQTGTATVTNGSTTVTAVTLTSAVLAPAPESFIALGSTTAKEAAVYKIVAVSGSTGAYTLTLDSPYVNPSVAIGTAITNVPIVTLAAPGTTKAGIRVTEFGNIFNGSNVLESQPNKILNISCNVNLSGTVRQDNKVVARSYPAANGTITTGVYTEGNGTYPQVFKKELVAAGYSGFVNRIFLPDNYPLYSVSTTNYVTLGLQYGTSVQDYTAQGFKAGETLSAIIAVPTGSSQATTLNTILASTNW